MKLFEIGETEKRILAVVVGSGNLASGYEIRKLLKSKANQDLSVGALYSTLDRLKRKGYLTYTVGEGGLDRGSRPQRFFSVSGTGYDLLRDVWLADQEVYGFAMEGGWQ
jgi:PadR family transcriptional regulator